MIINNVYDIGEAVYLITDEDQLKHIITGIVVRPQGIMYELSYGSERPTVHYDIEISNEKTFKF